MATELGKRFLQIVEHYGIEEIRHYHVDDSFHASGDVWQSTYMQEHSEDFYDEDTQLGELVTAVIPEVFFDSQPELKEDATPEENVDGKWIVYMDADPDEFFAEDASMSNLVFSLV